MRRASYRLLRLLGGSFQALVLVRTATDSGGSSIPEFPRRGCATDASASSHLPSGSGTVRFSRAKLQATAAPPRSSASQPAASSCSVRTWSSRPLASAGTARRSRMRRRYHSSNPRWGSFSRSGQSRRERSNVRASWGSGIFSGSHPKAANSRRRPSLTACAQGGVGEMGEVLEGRRRSPFLALEEHRDERGGQHQGGRDLGALDSGQMADALPAVRGCPPGRGSGCRPGSGGPRARRRPRPWWRPRSADHVPS